MGRLDAVPADDLGIQRSIAHYYYHDKRIDEKKVREIAAPWGRWKSPAIFYLMTASRLGVEIQA